MLRIFCLLIALLFAGLSHAQTTGTGPDYTAWDRQATAIETTLATSDPSEVYLTNQRANVATMRTQFADAQTTNSTRIVTLREQIIALGAVPADGETEPAEITARRQELQAQLDALEAPRLRATEAFTRADGIIQEIDRRLDAELQDRLLELGPSPLDPRAWPAAMLALGSSLTGAFDGVKLAVSAPAQLEESRDQLPLILLFLIIGILLITQSRKRVEQATQWIEVRETNASHGFAAFIVSLGQVLLPFLGIVMLLQAASTTGLFGPRVETLLETLPLIGFVVLAARWLGNRVFNIDDPESAVVQLDPKGYAAGRRMSMLMGIVLGASLFVDALAEHDAYSDQTIAVLSFAFIVLAGAVLLRLAQLLLRAHKRAPDVDPAEMPAAKPTGIGIKKRLSQAAFILTVVSILANAIGYTEAARAIIFPFIYTVGVVALLSILFEAVRDFFAWIATDTQAGREGLLPVLTNAILLMVSIPGVLLIWGMRVSDLTEYWQTFKGGFRMGETQISPGVFAAFVIVFAIGYFITRLIQRTLRNTILPKTKIDIGGQTAMVSGFGYVGIFVAALVAISAAGLDLSSLAIVAGALSVGIGFGLQNIVSNFVSGIILLIERPIGEGDWIEVGGNMGIVKDISVRSTRIETFDRTDLIVPNADLVSGTVTNYTRGNTVGRIIVAAGAAYGSDTRQVERILRDIAEAHPLISLNPAPAVVFTGFGADSLDFEIRAIMRDISNGVGVKTELRHQIYERFKEEGIEIPFMQRDIWIKNPEAIIPTEKDD